jgi:hypothetical protein
MNDVTEETLQDTVTQFLAEVEFAHDEPISWENEKGGQEFIINAKTTLENGLFLVCIQGDETRRYLSFYCSWDVHIPPRKRQEVAEMVTRLNYGLCLGNFEMDYYDGEVRFKSTLAYEGIPLNFANMRAHFYVVLGTMNRWVPWIESVIINEHGPEEATNLARKKMAGTE